MKVNAVLASAVGASLVAAAPLEERQSGNIDVTVLQFALTLEHLENNFYVNALKKFSEADFAKAGYPSTYYEDLRYIASDEQSHVALLTSAVAATGATPVQPCTYNFPYTDVKSFITLSSIIEGVGTSAYLGGAPLITSKDYLTVAGSILVVEALHTSYQRAAVGEVPFANPYGTPLDPTSVFTLATAFITSCPPGNAPLPFVPFPGLAYNATDSCPAQRIRKRGIACRSPKPSSTTGSGNQYGNGGNNNNGGGHNNNGGDDYNNGGHNNNNGGDDYNNGGHGGNKPSPTYAPWPTNSPVCEKFAGDSIVLTATGNTTVAAGTYVTFVSGLGVASVQGTVTGQNVAVAIPAVAQGQTYVFLTSAAANGKLDTTTIIAGPAIVEVTPPPPVVNYNI